VRLAVVLALLGGGLACARSAPGPAAAVAWSPEPAPDLGAVVARVGEVPIFAGEVRAQALRTGKPARAALDELVGFHLLAEKARALGIEPDAAAAVPAELLVQRLIERDFEAVTRPADLPEQDLRRSYERARDWFVHSRLVEIAILSVYTGALMKPEPRARARATAAELSQAISARPARTAEDFLEVARDPAWASRRVSVTRLWQSSDKPFGPRVGAAVLRLRAPGDTTALVEDESGYHIARYIAERPARDLPFEAARQEIRREAYPRWRQARFAELVARLSAQHRIELSPENLP
jgi:hypothetical protein